jgi:DNA-binding NarL/FixJ family response regulator
MDRLRILLADDHKMIREGLKMLVNAEPDMEVVGEANNGWAAIALALELKPDVVVMDVSMPELNGLKTTQKLKELFPEIKVIALTRHKDDSYVHELLHAGASGYVLKLSAGDELVRAIRTVVEGKTYIDPEVMESIVEAAVARKTTSGPAAERELSSREEEVLRHTALGYSNKEIATQLKISVRTVEVHKAKAMQKLDMKSRIDIVRYAILKGWLQTN